MHKWQATALAAALVLSPFAAQAEGGFYGSLRIGIQYFDAGDDSNAIFTFRNWASRMGYSGSTELDNGLTGFGKLEFGVDTGSSANGNGSLNTRLAYVGVKGDFGSLLLGQAYHAWYNTIIAPVDQPWWGSCNGCVSYTGRSENGLTYSTSGDLATFAATVYMRDETGDGSFDEDIDGYEVGASFNLSSLTVGVGYRDWDDGNDGTIGVSVKGDAGDLGYAANITRQGIPENRGGDALGIDVYLSYGNSYIDLGTVDRTDRSIGFTLGHTLSIGTDTTAWFEVGASDSGVDGSSTAAGARAALKYDWN